MSRLIDPESHGVRNLQATNIPDLRNSLLCLYSRYFHVCPLPDADSASSQTRHSRTDTATYMTPMVHIEICTGRGAQSTYSAVN